ncbi:hypothetical protein BDC45DRAFT_129833 [Circinella umbellata]|nr:hypothetical protein BDC45DRAFT_129833 [Circinella umbellata]
MLAGEVGKRATITKYYHDRMKLAVGAKSQLNQLISKYKLSTIEATKLKICTIQILGTEAELSIFRLVGKGVYVFEKTCGFQLPIALETFVPTMERLIASMMLLNVIMMLKYCIRDEMALILLIV